MSQADPRFLPVSGMELPRFAGVPSFMRLPVIAPDAADEVEIGLVGVPWDGGTTNRPGARHGPRQLRDCSTMIRLVNQATGHRPFHTARMADLGDCPVNPAGLEDTLERVTRFYAGLCAKDVVPMSMGGDHLISLPILRALAPGQAPLGLVQFDAHTDLFDSYFGGQRYTHGTPFRRAIEEGLLDPERIVQIGLRGTSYDMADIEFAREAGVRLIFIEELMDRGPLDVMHEVHAIQGTGPVYASFDIDAIDPGQAPGTGTPEIGGIPVHMAQRLVRGLEGLDLIGADLVEVSPPFDPNAVTAWVGIGLVFELLCPLAGAVAARREAAAA